MTGNETGGPRTGGTERPSGRPVRIEADTADDLIRQLPARFATAEPGNPRTGMVYLDAGNGILKVRIGDVWGEIPIVIR